jgi:hypothetical protein
MQPVERRADFVAELSDGAYAEVFLAASAPDLLAAIGLSL